MATFTLTPVGPFSLAESVGFGFGQRHATTYDGVMRLAFCTDGLAGSAAVVVRQDADGTVRGEVVGSEGAVRIDEVAAQVARMLSLDVDATGYVAIGERDEVVARLLAAAPGLRPPLFHSPYEAAAWSVLCLRVSQAQASAVRDRLAATLGVRFTVDGAEMGAFPTPHALLAAPDLPGVAPVKAERLRGLARAALDGRLDPTRLRALDPAEALAELRTLPGLGAFYAQLVLVRGTGVTDVLATGEPRLLRAVGDLYGLGGSAREDQLRAIAETWRPFRTWVSVLTRAAGRRLDPRAAAPGLREPAGGGLVGSAP